MNNQQINNIPDELKRLKQWVCFSLESNRNLAGKPVKVPMIPGVKIPATASTKEQKVRASVSKPGNWRCFSYALSKVADYDGLGFVFRHGDPYSGIDIDNCRNKLTGKISPVAQKIIDRLNSYTEVSYSQTGIHIIVNAKLPSGRCNFSLVDKDYPEMAIEIYSTGRYFIFTGNKIGKSSTINQRQSSLINLHKKLTELNTDDSVSDVSSTSNKATKGQSCISEVEWEELDTRTLNQKLSDFKNTGNEADFNAAYKELKQLTNDFALMFLMNDCQSGINSDMKEYYWGYTDNNYSEWLMLPMLKALNTWNPNRGNTTAKFKNYFANKVKMLVKDTRASYCRELNSIYKGKKYTDKKIAPLPLKLDKLENKYRYSSNDDSMMSNLVIEEFCNKNLSKRQNQILHLWISGYKQNEIAEIVGVGRRKISDHQEKIRIKLKSFFAEGYF